MKQVNHFPTFILRFSGQ